MDVEPVGKVGCCTELSGSFTDNGINNCWPTIRLLLVRLFILFISSIVALFSWAIFHKLSPFFTVYVK